MDGSGKPAIYYDLNGRRLNAPKKGLEHREWEESDFLTFHVSLQMSFHHFRKNRKVGGGGGNSELLFSLSLITYSLLI